MTVVRRIALDGLADMGAGGIAPKLVPLLRGDDDTLAERAATLLAQQGAEAESTLRKEVRAGSVGARRVMAQLLLRRGTQPAIDAVLDQLSDPEFGEQALQLVRAELDKGNEKLANQVEKSAIGRASEAAKELHKAWAKAQKSAERHQREQATPRRRRRRSAEDGRRRTARTVTACSRLADPLRDPEVAQGIAQLGALLRLIGYLARPSTQSLLLKYADADEPRPIRLAAIAGLRRIVAQSEAKGTEKVIETLIDYADGDDFAVAQSAVDTLRGARIPDSLAKTFAGAREVEERHGAEARDGAHARRRRCLRGEGARRGARRRRSDGARCRGARAREGARGGDAARHGAARHRRRTDRAALRRRDPRHRGHVSNQAIEELVEQLRELMEKTSRARRRPTRSCSSACSPS